MPSDRRLHPLSPLFSIGSSGWKWLVPGLLLMLTARSGGWQVWIMLLFVPATVYELLRYATYRYDCAKDELVIRSGIIFRNERHIPYQRIHNIGSRQNLLHRILGVAEVGLETAGGEEPEARLRVLSLAALEELRRRVFEQKIRTAAAPAVSESSPAGDLAAMKTAAAEPARVLLHLAPLDVGLYGIIDNRGMVVVGAALGLAWEVGWLGGLEMPGSGAWRGAWSAAHRLSSLRGALLFLAALTLLLMTLRLLSVCWATLTLHGFTLRRAGHDLTTICGLFTRVSATIPLHRIQVLSIRQRPIHRLFGCAEVRVETAGAGASQGAHVSHQLLAPLIDAKEVPRLVREVLSDLDFEAMEWRPVDPRARRRIMKTWVIIAGLATLQGVIVARWWGLTVLPPMLMLAWLNARLQSSHMRYSVARGAVAYRSGWLWRHLSIARFSKIQSLALGESPFDRRYGMATLRVDTAGAARSIHRLHVPYLEMRTARRIFDDLTAEAARTSFRWT